MKRSVFRGMLVLLLGVTVGCQSTSSVAPKIGPIAVQPLAGIGTMTPAEMTGNHVRFSLTDHDLALRLPDGFCIANEKTPENLQNALAKFLVSLLDMKVLAFSCAVLEGKVSKVFPIPMVVAGLVRREGLPMVMDEEGVARYARMVRFLDHRDDSETRLLAREIFLSSIVDSIESAGFSVGHLDMRSRDNRIRLEVLAEMHVNSIGRKIWYFGDFLAGPVGDRLLGIGVVNMDQNPTPPATDQDSESLFANLRQVRN